MQYIQSAMEAIVGIPLKEGNTLEQSGGELGVNHGVIYGIWTGELRWTEVREKLSTIGQTKL